MNLRRITPALILPLLTSAFVVSSHPIAVRAANTYVYDVAGNDGYGLEDCLAGGKECGYVVADAWCEAHGHAHALEFGLRSAMEGSPTRVSTSSDPYVITCGD